MSGALASFMMMAIGGRELSDTMNIFQILLLRSLVGLPILLIVLSTKGFKFPRTQRLKIHLFRNLLHYGAQAGWFLGVTLLPLATVFAIEFTTPIWVAIMAVYFLGERMNRGRLVAILFGFAGILVILRPGVEVFDVASLAVFWAAIGYAASYVITKDLSRTETPLTIIFYMAVVQGIIGLVPGLMVWIVPGMEDIIWIVFIGIAGLTSHFCLVKAFSHADATVVIPIDFLRLPLAAVIGFFMYQEAFEVTVLAGAVVIFAGNYYNIRVQTSTKTEA